MELEPIDLNALKRERKARQAAAGQQPYVFLFGAPPEKDEDPSNRYEIPPEADWPAAIGPPFDSGDLPAAFAILLGPDQWARLVAAGIEIGDLIDLEAWLSAQQGLKNQGEGLAPNGSSNSTALPSDPTSDGSTGSTSPPPSPPARRTGKPSRPSGT
jgi:hypothetical protein